MTGKTMSIGDAILAVLACVWSGAAAAMPAFMPAGTQTSQPVGHYEFCLQFRDECQAISPSPEPTVLTRELWDRLVEINHVVNQTTQPVSDMELWGREEVWSYPVEQRGDCEDMVLEKRRQLLLLGLPAGNLLITVARQSNGEGHAVLSVRTHLGDFVLDNLEQRILLWHETDYQFLKRQSNRHAGVWISIDDGRATAVGSVQ